ncbi:SpaH/EbpB family LPXTG-anchored major pilin [Corynebacterium crudilactis]|uniref:Gram-positive cocci surface proteins LPxTG domain-containing protein n=1 Tax=Corynebacterium crudilactis TaxID=1652495 RepID=A0A172QWH7_9CORY|nr:SpaH/EbpB family LPXTG-anchored major pilin [Corynebacterium crudilactis]ANE05062.1 hypothetical protein ccrud_13210 [Corynebacterium crudilactis]
MNKNHKRISAAVLALALGFSTAGAGIFAPVAGAQIESTIIDDINEIQPTLTIEKYIGMPVGDPGEYNPEIQTALNTLEKGYGAEFTIERLNIDLTTVKGWNDVKALTPSTLNAAAKDSTFTDRTVTTGKEGTPNPGTVKVNLPVGVYRVTETGAPTNVDGVTYQEAAPFFVTLPFTDPATGKWSYSQTVRPKNQAAVEINKDVRDENVTADSKISYTISAPVPAGNLTQLVITDNLPASLTDATNVKVGTNTGTDGAFAALPAGSIDPITDYRNLTISLTEAGLTELQARRATNPDLQILVTFDTTVVEVPENGAIRNDASIDLGGGLTYSTQNNGNHAETRFGDLTIEKVDTAGELITTGSAAFDLYRCDSYGATTTPSYTTVGDKLAANLTTTDGSVILPDTQVWNFVNGELTSSPDSTVEGEHLCVVETKAPTGYSLNPEPQPVKFTEDEDDGYAMVVDVTNLTTDEAGGGQLPSTGGMGTMALIAGGLVVAAAGGAAAVRGNRARS